MPKAFTKTATIYMEFYEPRVLFLGILSKVKIKLFA
jgi:hypothetical protein